MDENKVIEHFCSAKGVVVNSTVCREGCKIPRDQCKLQKLSDYEDLLTVKLNKTDALLILGALEYAKCSGCEIKHPTKCNECDIGHLKSRMLMAAYGPKGV